MLPAMVRFEGYTVLRKAGAGGLADVYVAEVPLDARPPAEGLLPGDRVALKILREPGRTGASVERFLREGRLLMEHPHPALPRCYAAVGGARPYLALELLEGATLRDIIRERGPLPHEVSLRVAEALLRVLSFLHERSVVHRDVKPANVYLTRDGRVLLLDLGLAADPYAVATEDLGDVMGTYAYMAPEQIAGAALDHRADLYSLGVTLYECITGKRPYKANGPVGYLRAHTLGDAEPLSKLRRDPIPPRLEELTGRLMCRDPAVRPATASVALAILTGHLSVRQVLRAPPLAGRDEVLGALEALLDGGGTLQIVGEPGMGQGRIAGWLLEEARARGHLVLAVRGAAAGGPLDPMRRLRAQLAREEGPLGNTRDALTRSLQRVGSRRKVLLLLEHLDRASPVAQAALGSLPLPSGAARVHLSGLPAEALGGRVLTLEGLDHEAVRRMVCGMLDTRTPPPGLVEKLHRFSGGLPAVVGWTLRDFHQRGTLRAGGIGEEGETRWSWTPQLRMLPDNSLSVLFRERLEGLEPAERRLLGLLSVAREELPLDVAAEAARVDSGVAAARVLASRALVTLRETTSGTWVQVRRPALGAIVSASLSRDAVREANARIAAVLAQRAPEPWRDEHLPIFEAYGASEAQAARAQVRMGEWLQAQGRNAQALEVLTRATHEPGLQGPVACRCALSRGRALLGLARPVQATEALVAGLGLAQAQGRRELVVRARLNLSECWLYRGDARRAMDLADEVLHEPDPRGNARALVLRGVALYRLGDLPAASASLSGAIEAAARDADLLTDAQRAVAELYAGAGRLEDAVRLVQVGLSRLRTRRKRATLVDHLCFLSGLRLRLGDVDAAVEPLREAEEHAEFADLPGLTAAVATARAAVHLACGDVVGAGELLRAAAWAGEHDADARMRLTWRALRVEVRMATQDHNAALATCNEVVEEYGRLGWEAARALHAGLIAVIRGQGEDLAEALDALAGLGEHRALGRLMLSGGRLGGDASALDSALVEARRSGDRFLLLEALRDAGGPAARREAAGLARGLLVRAGGGYAGILRGHPAVRWALESA